MVVTQLATGAFGVLWLLDLAGQADRLWITAMALVVLAGVSLAASALHLGRPLYAWRAMYGLRHSWLSREVLTLSLFSFTAAIFATFFHTFVDHSSACGAGGCGERWPAATAKTASRC